MKHCNRCGKDKPLSEFRILKGKYVQTYCKECERELASEHYHKNPQPYLERSKIQRLLDPDGHNEKVAQWRDKNRDKISDSHKSWIRRNADRVKEYMRSWRKNNPEKVRDAGRRRRALLTNSEGSFTDEEFQKLVLEANGKCVKCGSSDNLCADHIIPISWGGKNTIDNIQVLCRRCNSRKKDKL